MYRPTVRMDDCFKLWIDEVVKVTGLDRNQIIRLALFSAPFSAVFLAQINSRKKTGVSLPPSPWKRETGGAVWRSNTWNKEEEEAGVSETQGSGKSPERETREIEKRGAGGTTGGNVGGILGEDRSRTRPASERRIREVHQPGGINKVFRTQTSRTSSGGIKITL